MHAYYPLLLTGGIIGFLSLILIVAYASIKDKKQSMGFDRHMKDGEIVRRLLAYARPYRGQFLFGDDVAVLQVLDVLDRLLIIAAIDTQDITKTGRHVPLIVRGSVDHIRSKYQIDIILLAETATIDHVFIAAL